MSSIYNLEIEEVPCETSRQQVEPGDRLFDINGIIVVIDSVSYPYLRDLKLDYAEDLMGGGFRFENPNVSSTCSCGQSFKIETT